MKLPEFIRSEDELNSLLSEPSEALVEMMKRIDGDVMILGIAGKMGLTMGRRAVNAIRRAGVSKKVIGVARFSNPDSAKQLEEWGVETIPCDLLDRRAVEKLPRVRNVVFMAGRKFGTQGSEDLTWAMNTVVPANVAGVFRDSRIVAFSTGCVYPLVTAEEGGCSEAVPPSPVGEYSQSCLGRERIFQYAARTAGTKILLFRLNYAVDLRYGVLYDIASRIYAGEKVDRSVGGFNVIWQGDANDAALRALELVSNPPAVLNVTGPETASLEAVARALAGRMGKTVEFSSASGSGRGYLSDSGRMSALFGYPSVPLEKMIEWQADWIVRGGKSLGKPTHFEVGDGKF